MTERRRGPSASQPCRTVPLNFIFFCSCKLFPDVPVEIEIAWQQCLLGQESMDWHRQVGPYSTLVHYNYHYDFQEAAMC
jgi:hypothetical protein